MDTATRDAPVLPDLRGIPLDQLAHTPLGAAIDLYRRRMSQASVPLSSFNSAIR